MLSSVLLGVGHLARVTVGSGTAGVAGTVSSANSLVGQAANTRLIYVGENTTAGTVLADGVGQVSGTSSTFSSGNTSVSSIVATLNSGTAVNLLASNDITVNAAITANPGAGALTLEAGRSILLNAGITTGNANLTLIANGPLSDGVIDGQRDPGAASITMASGTTLNAGTGSISMQLLGAGGKTNGTAGTITVDTLTAQQITLSNTGATSGAAIGFASASSSITATTATLTANAGTIALPSMAVTGSLTVNGGTGTITIAKPVTASGSAGVSLTAAALTQSSGGTIAMGTGFLQILADTLDAERQRRLHHRYGLRVCQPRAPQRLNHDRLGSGAGTLNLSVSSLSTLSGFSGVSIGGGSQTGTITLGGTLTVPFPVSINAQGAGGSIVLDPTANLTINPGVGHSVNLTAGSGGSITQSSGATVAITTGFLGINTNSLVSNGAVGSIAVASGASALINPLSGSTTIGIGTGAGALNVSAAGVAAFAGAGSLSIGSSSSQTGTITFGGSSTFNIQTNVGTTSGAGNSIVFDPTAAVTVNIPGGQASFWVAASASRSPAARPST